MPLLCAFAARVSGRPLRFGILLPWVDYTLLSLVTFEILTMPFGGGGGWMWQSLTR